VPVRRLLVFGLLAATAAAEPQSPDIAPVLAEGEQLLAAGDGAGAEAAFDRAAAVAHEPAIEISLMRAYMQRGDYRRALAFGAHAAGAHGEEPAASALYAWLLASGGQQQVAHRLIDSALAANREDMILRTAAERLAERMPTAGAPLLVPPARFAPYSSGAAAAGSVAATATLSADGSRALAPGTAVPENSAIWLRNGLGEAVAARVERRFAVEGIELALLVLEEPLPAPAGQTAAARAPFAGSVGYAVEYAAHEGGEAAWPWLELGFFGPSVGADALPALGIDLRPGPRGGPAFDDAGRIVGVATRAADGSDRLVPVATLPEDVRPLLGAPSFGAPTPRTALDLTYERALLVALQLIVDAER
jgi:tetratricopeptide (TPR) repeat protein